MRRPVLVALLALAALLVAGPGRDDHGVRAGDDEVVRVVDGDTVVLRGAGKSRLIGVDTPEVFGGGSASDARRRRSRSGCCARGCA